MKCVFGVIGREDTATIPAPLKMIDTTVKQKPAVSRVRPDIE